MNDRTIQFYEKGCSDVLKNILVQRRPNGPSMDLREMLKGAREAVEYWGQRRAHHQGSYWRGIYETLLRYERYLQTRNPDEALGNVYSPGSQIAGKCNDKTKDTQLGRKDARRLTERTAKARRSHAASELSLG